MPPRPDLDVAHRDDGGLATKADDPYVAAISFRLHSARNEGAVRSFQQACSDLYQICGSEQLRADYEALGTICIYRRATQLVLYCEKLLPLLVAIGVLHELVSSPVSLVGEEAKGRRSIASDPSLALAVAVQKGPSEGWVTPMVRRDIYGHAMAIAASIALRRRGDQQDDLRYAHTHDHNEAGAAAKRLGIMYHEGTGQLELAALGAYASKQGLIPAPETRQGLPRVAEVDVLATYHVVYVDIAPESRQEAETFIELRELANEELTALYGYCLDGDGAPPMLLEFTGSGFKIAGRFQSDKQFHSWLATLLLGLELCKVSTRIGVGHGCLRLLEAPTAFARVPINLFYGPPVDQARHAATKQSQYGRISFAENLRAPAPLDGVARSGELKQYIRFFDRQDESELAARGLPRPYSLAWRKKLLLRAALGFGFSPSNVQGRLSPLLEVLKQPYQDFLRAYLSRTFHHGTLYSLLETVSAVGVGASFIIAICAPEYKPGLQFYGAAIGALAAAAAYSLVVWGVLYSSLVRRLLPLMYRYHFKKDVREIYGRASLRLRATLCIRNNCERWRQLHELGDWENRFTWMDATRGTVPFVHFVVEALKLLFGVIAWCLGAPQRRRLKLGKRRYIQPRLKLEPEAGGLLVTLCTIGGLGYITGGALIGSQVESAPGHRLMWLGAVAGAVLGLLWVRFFLARLSYPAWTALLPRLRSPARVVVNLEKERGWAPLVLITFVMSPMVAGAALAGVFFANGNLHMGGIAVAGATATLARLLLAHFDSVAVDELKRALGLNKEAPTAYSRVADLQTSAWGASVFEVGKKCALLAASFSTLRPPPPGGAAIVVDYYGRIWACHGQLAHDLNWLPLPERLAAKDIYLDGGVAAYVIGLRVAHAGVNHQTPFVAEVRGCGDKATIRRLCTVTLTVLGPGEDAFPGYLANFEPIDADLQVVVTPNAPDVRATAPIPLSEQDETASVRPANTVFVSYNSKDRTLAKCLVNALEAGGMGVLWDQQENCQRPGESVSKMIEEMIGQAAHVVFCFGPKGVTKWQKSEYQLAINLQSKQSERLKSIEVVVLPGGQTDDVQKLSVLAVDKVYIEASPSEAAEKLLKGWRQRPT